MDETLKALSNNIFNLSDASSKELLCLLHIYISPNSRAQNICFELLKKMFLLKNSDKELPVIMETRYDSRLYPISRLL
jgi:hypothetical protein